EVNARTGPDGGLDFTGPYVHGRAGDRFLYLSWGTVDGAGTFEMFRRAKIRFADIDAGLMRDSMAGGTVLVGRLALTDRSGHPLCARVRPEWIDWRLATAGAG
ncbi:MAG TPA: DUF5990 family protein, partial [Micromonosporaceae bacterium]|nr:DUF5990 family protein [Micromonosporaceae bacterium]